MAPAKKVVAAGELVPLSAAKVKKLLVKNFRCIGPQPVEIELDDIVVLVGPNNAGKSTVLRAYEVVMSHGSAAGRLKLEDFPEEKVNEAQLPEIELQTYVFDDKPGEQWLHQDADSDAQYVRERWIWSSPDSEPKRQGHRNNAADWDEQVPWGAPNVANSRRPIPHRVDAFASPEKQAEAISDLLKELLVDRAKQAAGEDQVARVQKLKEQIALLQSEIVDQSKEEIDGIENALSTIVSDVFTGFKVSLDPRAADVADKALSLFSAAPTLRMGPEGGHLSLIDKQGSGARRTLLWSALKLLSERSGQKVKSKLKKMVEGEDEAALARPHVLLMDEPEICLHPHAVREACRVLYGLAEGENPWQIIITTHSPVFIDLSRDDTTVVRVERRGGDVVGTTVYRPTRAKLDDDDRAMLKLLNVYDPYVAEFFFGGRVVLVEGDTEYSAFRCVIGRSQDLFRDVHVVRARGKAILVPLIKIMNHFGASYSVLHDSDKPTLESGNANGAWTMNQRIQDEVKRAPNVEKVRIVASCPNFEEGVLRSAAKGEKPYSAIVAMANDGDVESRVTDLLTALIDHQAQVPEGAFIWRDLTDLEALARRS